MLRIGLTGGIASGKSSVASQFAELGAEIVDTDVVSRELVVPGSPALAAIVERFGEAILNPDGTLARAKLRQLVFADADLRRDLEAILHPLIRQRAMTLAADSEAPYVIFVVPLLFETGFDRIVDRTLVVDCPEALQLSRLTARDGMSSDEAGKIIAAQMPRQDRLDRADDVIDNSGALAETKAQVTRLDDAYKSMSRNCSAPSGHAE